MLLDSGIRHTDHYSDYVEWRNGADPNASVHYQTTADDIPAGRNPFRAVIGRELTPVAWTGRETRGVLETLASDERPCLSFSSYFKPHSPHTIPEPYDALYDEADIPLPKVVGLDYIQRLPLPVQKMILRGTPRCNMDRQRLMWMYRSYFGDMTWLDEEAGATLRELDSAGQTWNTIAIVTTDHSDQMLEHGLLGKNAFSRALSGSLCW